MWVGRRRGDDYRVRVVRRWGRGSARRDVPRRERAFEVRYVQPETGGGVRAC